MKIQDTNTNHAHRSSGAGGSHGGLFGRPTICMNEEGGGNGGGTPPPAPAPIDPGTAPGEGSKSFNQEQVNQIVAQRLAEDRARRPGGSAPPVPAPPPKPPKDDGPLSLAKLQQQNEDLALRMSFDKRANKIGLDDEQSDELFELFRVQRPDDPGAWFEKKSKVFGFKSTTTAPPASDPTTTPPAPPNGPPLSDKGSPAPGDARDFERKLADNPLGFGGVDLERLIAKHGEVKARRLWVEAAQRKAGAIKITR